MDSKEFINELTARLGCSDKETTQLVGSFVDCMVQELQEGKAIVLQDFGTFEVEKKKERVVLNPLTKQRFLVPPQLSLCFKPHTILKDKLKNRSLDE